MARRPRALLISWLFPPHGSTGAKRAYRMARHLPSSGWDVTVLCGREPPAHSTDHSPWPLPDGVRVVYDYDPAWLTTAVNAIDTLGRKLATSKPATTTASNASALKKTAFGRVQDVLAQWLHDALPTETVAVHLPHALRAAERVVREERPDVVWTTSYPYSAHLLGVALARKFALPFVCDLRDPWTLNFTHEEKWPHARWVERRLEALTFAHADRITVTTEALADAYRAVDPSRADLFVALRNGFDPRPLPAREVPSRPVRLIHFGQVYAARTLRGVFESVRALLAAGAITEDEIAIENYGRLADADREAIASLGLSRVVKALSPVDYGEGLHRLRNAHLLLLPAAGTDRGPLFLPGKLYDYLLAGAPILGLGQNGELSKILAHTRTGSLLEALDVNGITSVLRGVIDGSLAFAPDADAVAEYAAPHGARRLAALFEEVCRERGRW